MAQRLGKNPWLTIWTEPRKTIKAIVNEDPRSGFFYLSAIFALQYFFSFLFMGQYGLKFDLRFLLIFLCAVILSPLIGAFLIYFCTWVLKLTGKLLKGEAPFINLRAVFAWSRAPLLIELGMWVFFLSFSLGYINTITLIFINIVSIIASVWSFLLLIEGIREVQKFSFMKAAANVLLTYIVFGLFILAIHFTSRLI